MARGERNYALGKIYRLVHGAITVYIGSSVMPLNKRMICHRSKARTGKTYEIYEYMRGIGIENVRIVLIENWPCTCKQELEQREQYWIDRADTTFPNVALKNKHRAYRSYQYTRTYQNVENRKYRRTEKGRVVYERRGNLITCHCGRAIRRSNIALHKKTKIHKQIVKRKIAELIAIMVLNSSLAAARSSTVQTPGES
jgi:hypothetical protein